MRMAIYHLRLTPVKRAGTALARSAHHTGTKLRVSAGALGRASYLAGQKLQSDRDGKAIDYRSKSEGVEFSAVILPGGGTMDREKLWNAIDNHPVRKDAVAPTVARDLIIATPHELTFEERKAANLELARRIADRYGVAVDIGMHRHTAAELAAGSDERNFHCHMLISERRVSPAGKIGKIQRDFNQMDCTRTDTRDRVGRLEPRQTAAAEIRQMWEEIANAALERGGHQERIDCRSYRDRGIDKEAGAHLGADATAALRESARKERSESRQPRTAIKAAAAAVELEALERAVRARRDAASSRIEELQRERRVRIDAYVRDRLGSLDAWVDDPMQQFIRAWEAADRASALRRQLREIDRRHVLRAATKEEDRGLQLAGRERHNCDRQLRHIASAQSAIRLIDGETELNVAARRTMARVKEITRAAVAAVEMGMER